jgi:predicted permease
MADYEIAVYIISIIVLIGIIYIWKEEKKKECIIFGDFLYLGAIFVILGFVFGSQTLVPISIYTVGIIFLSVSLIGNILKIWKETHECKDKERKSLN